MLATRASASQQACPRRNRSWAGRGLVHFSAKQRYFQRQTMPENMDLSPYRPKGTVPVNGYPTTSVGMAPAFCNRP